MFDEYIFFVKKKTLLGKYLYYYIHFDCNLNNLLKL